MRVDSIVVFCNSCSRQFGSSNRRFYFTCAVSIVVFWPPPFCERVQAQPCGSLISDGLRCGTAMCTAMFLLAADQIEQSFLVRSCRKFRPTRHSASVSYRLLYRTVGPIFLKSRDSLKCSTSGLIVDVSLCVITSI